MAEQLLNNSNVRAPAQQVGCERVAPLVRVQNPAIWKWILAKDTSYVTRVHPFCCAVQKYCSSARGLVEVWAPFI
jgi:hypothetical protein